MLRVYMRISIKNPFRANLVGELVRNAIKLVLDSTRYHKI
jgi:hypothetical protein